MNENNSPLNANALAFIAIANEYCSALEHAAETERLDFINTMVRLLPRLYIMATDLHVDADALERGYLDQALDEEQYESVRNAVASVIEPDDVYLEVFEEDMKYSDTPVSASISEGLADLYQVFYNLLATVRDATDETILLAFDGVKEDFKSYWSQTLCNLLRPINALATALA